MPSRSLDRFNSAITDADHLASSFAPKAGLAKHRPLLYQSCIIKSVAAWDGYVNDVVRETAQRLRRPKPTHYLQVLDILDANIEELLKYFNVPSTQNVRILFQRTIGLDPTTNWKRPKANQSAHDAGLYLDEILKVRHSLAHGFTMPAFAWNRSSSGATAVGRASAVACASFLRHIATSTDVAIANHVDVTFQLKKPW